MQFFYFFFKSGPGIFVGRLLLRLVRVDLPGGPGFLRLGLLLRSGGAAEVQFDELILCRFWYAFCLQRSPDHGTVNVVVVVVIFLR